MFIVDFLTGFVVDSSRALSAGDYFGAFVNGSIALLILAIIFLVGFFVFWLCFNRNSYSEKKTTKAKVLKTSFVPSHGGTHLSPVIGGKGGVVISSDYEEEKDLVVLKSEDIGRVEIDDADLLESVEKGDTVHLTYQEKYTYWSWNPSAKTFDDYIFLMVETGDGTEIEV